MRALQLIYAFFLGLAVAGFVGIGLDTFYPQPDSPSTIPPLDATPEQEASYRSQLDAHSRMIDEWNLNTGIALLVLATLILVVALMLGQRWVVLSNGLLLGGFFTLLHAVIRSSATDSLARFLVTAAALAVTIVVGWFRFTRRTPSPAPVGASDGELDLERRVAALEHRIESLRRALTTDRPER